jgi:hypothetical protein
MEICIPLLLDFIALHMQHFLFVLTMKRNSKFAMVEPHTCTPVTRLWKQLTSSQIVVHKMLEYIKVVKISIVSLVQLKMSDILIKF